MAPIKPFTYKRRPTNEVRVGRVVFGGDNPVRLQSMTSTSTMDTDGSVEQIKRILDAGADAVRLTAQGVREAENLGEISKRLRAEGYDAPLVADIHFNPKAAFAAAEIVEKVRINPGNFIDPARTFRQLTFTDEEYASELQRLEDKLVPFIELCRANNTAIRIGVNHGSLSDRIMSRYGDTPAGMVESAMEFLRVFARHNFSDVVISIKASNTLVMVETVRRLVEAMDGEDMHYPLHLGVTEAGNGEDGRVKSALGIGALLADGIGDTIRVSLSEAPEREIPVARMLADHFQYNENEEIEGTYYPGFDRLAPARRKSRRIGGVGGHGSVVLGVDPIYSSDLVPISANLPHKTVIEIAEKHPESILVITATGRNVSGRVRSALHALTAAGITNPIIVSLCYDDKPIEQVTVEASADFGAILLDGFVDGIALNANRLLAEERGRLCLAILQAARLRFSHTEYISCPGCGRTLFDLEDTVDKIKKATSHLPGLKIGVMGCIVNGPGEMADADYGYVGAAAGMVSLYKGKECIEKNIPSSEALSRLIQLLKDEGRWIEPIENNG